MASDSLLESLAGLFSGLDEGLSRAEARKLSKKEAKSAEEDRAFRKYLAEEERKMGLKQFEAESKRNALLDQLRVRLGEIEGRKSEQDILLAEEEEKRKKAQLTDIPVTFNGKTVTLPKALADQLRAASVQEGIENPARVSITDPNGRAFEVRPEDAARFYTESNEAKNRRAESARSAVIDLYKSMLQDPSRDPAEAAQAVMGFAQQLYPEEFGGAPPKGAPLPMVPPQQTEDDSVDSGGGVKGAIMRALGGPVGPRDPFRSLEDRVEAVRESRYGPSITNLMELEKSRADAWARGAAGPPPPGKYFNVDPDRPYGRMVPPAIDPNIQSRFPGMLHSQEDANAFLAGRLRLSRPSGLLE